MVLYLQTVRLQLNNNKRQWIMIRVEKMYKGSWYEESKCKSMREAKRQAKNLSKTHNGEVKAEKTDKNNYNLETVYFEDGKQTSSYKY